MLHPTQEPATGGSARQSMMCGSACSARNHTTRAINPSLHANFTAVRIDRCAALSPHLCVTGDLEHDDTSSVWDDWDENCFGEQDCEESREEYPDGFTWSCCGKNGTHPGCTRGPHRAVGATRGRYSSQDCPQTHGSPDEGPNSEHDDEGEDDEHDEE